MGVIMHPELYFEIIRPMVNELGQSDLICTPKGQLKIEHIPIKLKFGSFEIWGLFYIHSFILKY